MVFLVLDVASLPCLQIIWGTRASFVCLLTSNLKYLLATGCISNFLWIIVVVFCYFLIWGFHTWVHCIYIIFILPAPLQLLPCPINRLLPNSWPLLIYTYIHDIYVYTTLPICMYVIYWVQLALPPMSMYLGLTPGVGEGLKWFSHLQQLLTTCRPSSRAGALWSSFHLSCHVVFQVLCR